MPWDGAVVLIAADQHARSTRRCRVRIWELPQGTTIRLEPFPRVLIEEGIGESLID